MKRRKTIVLYAVMFLLLCTAGWAAADENVIDLAALPAQTSELRITSDCVLTGTLNSSCPIVVDADVTVTLRNVTINRTGEKLAGINCQKNVTIVIEGENNNISGGDSNPGIFIANDKKLTIGGTGTLQVSGGAESAGIGGGRYTDNYNAGDIEINGGTITAQGGKGAAGIGSGGHNTSCKSITVNNGAVHAFGGVGGAGIGAGTSTCGNILITGGTIEAKGGMCGAGIGSGSCNILDTNEYSHSKCGTITIQNGKVTAAGGTGGAGIGTGGELSDIPNYDTICGDITISGGNITAKSGMSAESIGYGNVEKGSFKVIIGGVDTGHQPSGTYIFGQSESVVVTAPMPVENLIYNGEKQVLTTSGTADGGEICFLVTTNNTLPDQAEFLSGLPEAKEAGTWYVWYKVVGDSNHTDTEPKSISVTISRKPVTVSGIEADNKIYDKTTTANLSYSSVVFTGMVVDGDDLSVMATGVFADPNAGTGKTVNISGITLGGDSSANYILATEGQQATTTADISQKEIALTWGKTSFTYDNQSHCPSVTAGGIIDGDEVQITVDGEQTNAGTYTATASGLTGKDAGNYRLPDDTDKTTIQFTISPADGSTLNVIVAPYNATYDGNAHGIAVSVSEIEGVTVCYGTKTGEYQLDSSPEYTDAGTYTVYYRIEATNYTPRIGSAEIKIQKKPVTVTAKDQTIQEGSDILQGTDQAELTGTLDGHVLDSVNLTAGNGSIIPDAAKIREGENDVTDNYSITYVSGKLTTLKAVSHTVTFTVINGAWDDNTTEKKTVVLTGFENDSLKLETNQIPAAGNKPGTAFRKGNWNIQPSTQTVITEDTTYMYTYAEKHDPQVTAPAAAELIYNGSEQMLVTEGTTTGGTLMYALATGQSKPDVNQYKTSVPMGKNAGSWVVWYYVQGDSENLDTEPNFITCTISKKTVTVSGIKAESKIYDKTTSAKLVYSEVALSGKAVVGDDLSVTATGTFADQNAGTGKTVNISGLTLEGDSAGNYMLAAQGQQTTTTANITQKEISLTWGETSFTYDNQSHCPSVTAGGIIDGDEVQIKVTGTQTNAGTYTATASGLTGKDAGNYRMPNNNTTQFTISPADGSALNVIVTPYNAMYDGYAHGIAVSVSEIEGVTVRYGTKTGEYQLDSSPEYTDAGSYTVYYQVNVANYTTRTGSANITIQKKPVKVTAKDQTIQEGGSIGSGTEQANLIDALAGHALASVNLAEENGNIIASSAKIYDRENRDVTDNYTITYESGKLTVIPEIDPADRAAADAVMQKIRAIGIVTYTDACAEKIEEARDAYNQLTDAQKALVDNAETLTIAERAFQELQKSFGLYHLDQKDGIVYEEDNDQNDVLRIWRSIRDGQTFDLFRYVQVDGYTLAKDVQYETAAGSIIITFKASYLNTLRPGEHPVTVGFSDGTIQTTLTIRDMTQEEAEPSPEDEAGIQTENGTPTETGKREKSGENETPTEEVQDIPKTGDAAHPALWMMITLLGACILCIILYKARRSE